MPRTWPRSAGVVAGALSFCAALLGAGSFAVGPAAASAAFDPVTIAPDSDVGLTLRVPHERGPDAYNIGVVVVIPAGWRVVSCAEMLTWTCSFGDSQGSATITYTKAGGSARAEDETFAFSLHAPAAPGGFAIPTRQVYSDGTSVDWVGAPGAAGPAPALVIADPNAPPPAAPAPPVPQAEQAPAAPVPLPTGEPAVDPAAAAVDLDVGDRMSWPAAAATVAVVVGGSMGAAAFHRRRWGAASDAPSELLPEPRRSRVG